MLIASVLSVVVAFGPSEGASIPRAARLLLDSDGMPRDNLSERELASLLLPKLVEKRERLREAARPSAWLAPTLMGFSAIMGAAGGAILGQAGQNGLALVPVGVLALALNVVLGIVAALLMTEKIHERAAFDAQPTDVDPMISELQREFPGLPANAETRGAR